MVHFLLSMPRHYPVVLRIITPNVGVIITRVIMAGNYITANAGSNSTLI